jgi:Domain of unknown function (DUF4157)/Protein-glutamine gamma-glutamyltransferase
MRTSAGCACTQTSARAPQHAVGARAYTFGQQIAFAPGHDAPSSCEGQRLIAHELAHTLQQRGSARFARTSGDWPAWHADVLSQVSKIAGPSDGKPADARWAGVWDILCRLTLDRAQSLLARLGSDAPGLVDKTDEFAVYVKMKFPKNYPLLIKTLRDIVTGAIRPDECATTETPLTTPSPATSAIDQAKDEVYRSKLAEAVVLLHKAGFARLEGIPTFQESTLRPPSDWDKPTFRPDYRRVEPHTKYRAHLILRPGIKPSVAIDDLFSRIEKSTFDCGQFVQAAGLYALRHSLGADAFDNVGTKDGVAFVLLPQDSSTLARTLFLQRPDPDSPLASERLRRMPENVPVDKSVARLLQDVPVGGRVMWTNTDAPIGSAFRNENTLKLGDDTYAAHGFPSNTRKNTYSRAELELLLAQTTNRNPDASYIARTVLVTEIEHFAAPSDLK